MIYRIKDAIILYCFVSRIAKEIEWQIECFAQIPAIVNPIYADSNYHCIKGSEFLIILSQPGELLLSIPSPVTAIEDQDHFALAQVIIEFYELFINVEESEIRRFVSNLAGNILSGCADGGQIDRQ